MCHFQPWDSSRFPFGLKNARHSLDCPDSTAPHQIRSLRPSIDRPVQSVVAAPKWPDELSRELGRDTVVLDAGFRRPCPSGHVIGAEQPVDPGEVYGEV